MSRRSQIVSPKYILRDMVLRNGGTMRIREILQSHQFRHHDESAIYQLVFQLRKENKGNDFGRGIEAWEMLDREVIGLERCLTQGMRRRIQMRRHAKERGVAEQNILDNLIFRGRIEHNGVVHKEEITRSLEASTKDLAQAASSSTSVRETLVEHEEDFED